MIRAVFDACVLFPPSLRDLLLNLAWAKLVQPYWSEEIHDEWMRSVLQNRPGVPSESLERTRRMMDAKFPRSLISGHAELVPNLELPDPNDRHVLALAIHTKSPLIVTANLKDFPRTTLEPHGIEAVSPDEFVMRLAAKKPLGVLAAANKHRSNLHNPPKTAEEYIDSLRRQGLTKTVAFLEQHRSEI